MTEKEKEYKKSIPEFLDYDNWHLPYVDEEDTEIAKGYENQIEHLKKISTARCAAVSYHRQGEKRDHDSLLSTFDKLMNGMGWNELP